jgi:hypothetical protein
MHVYEVLWWIPIVLSFHPLHSHWLLPPNHSSVLYSCHFWEKKEENFMLFSVKVVPVYIDISSV